MEGSTLAINILQQGLLIATTQERRRPRRGDVHWMGREEFEESLPHEGTRE